MTRIRPLFPFAALAAALALLVFSFGVKAGEEVPFGDKAGEAVLNYNRTAPTIATGGAVAPGSMAALKAKGFRTVIDLRMPEEGTAEERAEAEAAGLNYVNIPMSSAPPTDAEVARFAAILADSGNHPILAHCASANRAGTMWALYRLARGVPLEIAIEEGRTVGMQPARVSQVRAAAGR